MRDRNKTKEQLIAELVKLRRRVAELEASEADHERIEEVKPPPRIGEILIEMGYLTKLQLEICLLKQGQSEGKLLGEIMVDSGVITPEQLLQGLSEQLKRM